MQSPQDLIGRTLQSKLMVTELLGAGAMGIVYRGFDAELLQHVAIKVLQPELAAHPELVTRFYREGAAARRVDHANTVRFLGKGYDQGVHFLVMELLDGRSLGALLDAERRISQVRAARMLIQVCDALGVAHERGIVHRDLKPDNVMVSGKPGDPLGEHLKLLDFGIAKRLPSAPAVPACAEDSFNNSDDLTACGALIGTPEYMAPEQCRGHEVDARTDVYACGVMLYRMVTGEVPFTADHPLEVCQLHLGEAPRRPSERMPGLHGAIERVILRAMSKAPSARHQSAAELRDDLVRALDQLAAPEGEATGTMVRAEIVDALASTVAADVRVDLSPLPALTPDAIPAPLRSQIIRRELPRIADPGERFREQAPVIAACVAFAAATASLLVTLGVLLQH